MTESVFRGGRPVVGFGEEASCHTPGKTIKPLVGLAAGAVLGGFVGSKIGKGHPKFGATLGGIWGFTGGAMWAMNTEPWCWGAT